MTSKYRPKPSQKPQSDELDYEALGVEAPSRDEHGTEDDIASRLSEKHLHDWRQRGATLFCVGCPWEHATEPRFLNHILTGTDERGMPILRRIK